MQRAGKAPSAGLPRDPLLLHPIGILKTYTSISDQSFDGRGFLRRCFFGAYLHHRGRGGFRIFQSSKLCRPPNHRPPVL
eukprot:scaffold48_cov311-Pinguiococcus_pyrenoidosus.AAC.306